MHRPAFANSTSRPGSLVRTAWIASALLGVLLSPARSLQAATFPEFVDPNPAVSNQFGGTVVALSTGNVVITSPSDDAGGSNAGAVYLFNGASGALISTLRGSTANDNIGSGGVVALPNGNYVILSPNWDNGAAANAGAATFGNGTTGVSGVVSSANSLVGSTASDAVGNGGVTVLTNGNYVVRSQNWNNGATVGVGAVTWGNGTTGVTGVVSAANSLVGSTVNDQVGGSAVTPLTNGNYVVASALWDNGAIVNAGAATWGNGATGTIGVVSSANSLVGSTANDNVSAVVRALTNGNYVVASQNWDNGAIANAGAATWGNGTTGVSGVVSAANSLVGSTANDNIGNLVATLTNGNYAVGSSVWDNGAIVDAGAVTWGNGTTGVIGSVSALNSLVGSTASDLVGGGGVTPLTNGNYVVASLNWDNGAIANVGAVTWCNGTGGAVGPVSSANSLVGSLGNDAVGLVKALTNGNYVVASSIWDNGAISNAGAVTWGNGTGGTVGSVSPANSLVGSTANDGVGGNGVIPITNGNYVVASPNWDNGAIVDAGAATWGSGTTGVTGAVSSANSLVGSTTSDAVASSGVLALSNGNYVVQSQSWHRGAIVNAGAATWGSGTGGVAGAITVGNSLVGSTTNDNVGNLATALSNGNYVVRNSLWDNGAAVNAGAATWGNGTTGTSGAASSSNSLVGSTTSDVVGNAVTPLANGNYVVLATAWDNGAIVNAGAATWGSGTTGVTGVVSSTNSLVGTSANSGMVSAAVTDDVNLNFYCRLLSESIGGRVRAGQQESDRPTIASIADVRNDQGRQVRLSFARSGSDFAGRPTPILGYYIYRREIVAQSVSARPAEPLRAANPDQTLLAGWDYVMTVPASTDSVYQTVVPTLADSNSSGFHRAVLFVRAATANPAVFFDSPPDSGWSADDLPPAPPAPFVGAYAGGGTHLHWNRNGESDFWYYAVYRGSSAGFTPGPGNLIATSSDTGYVDVGPAGSFYKLSAIDVNGNESAFALLTPNGTTAVDAERAVAFALDGARPNPTSGRGLHVSFALPTAAAARLELLDVTGRRVIEREVGSLGIGPHVVNLAEGHRVPVGLYWVRLSQGANRRMARVAVIE